MHTPVDGVYALERCSYIDISIYVPLINTDQLIFDHSERADFLISLHFIGTRFQRVKICA